MLLSPVSASHHSISNRKLSHVFMKLSDVKIEISKSPMVSESTVLVISSDDDVDSMSTPSVVHVSMIQL